jgi:pyruvate/2-oxoglutarate/acetoin dehydrogenase E1 component
LEIKEILYKSIEKHSEYVVSDISQGKSSEIIKTIQQECIYQLDKIIGNKAEILGTFAEGFVHYLLTTALISSQRKIIYNNVYVDISIPDVKTLSTFPQNTVVISFPKTNDICKIKTRLEEISMIQPIKENIWFVLENEKDLGIRTYSIKNDGMFPFSNIINDIIGFLTNKKQSNLKLFRV